MASRIVFPTVLLAGLATALAVQAGPVCDAGGEKLPPEKVRAMYEEKGYEIKVFKETDGGCYEIYGYENGKKVEIYIDPKTGEILERHED